MNARCPERRQIKAAGANAEPLFVAWTCKGKHGDLGRQRHQPHTLLSILLD
jgi:hypothetical protein